MPGWRRQTLALVRAAEARCHRHTAADRARSAWRPRTGGPATPVKIAIAVSLLSLAAGGALAQRSQAWTRCAGGKGISPDGQISGCTAIIQSGRENPQDLARAFSNRGTAYFGKGDYRRAIQDYSQVINLEPDNATALDNRCWTRATVGLLGEALQDCEQSLRLRPNHEPTLATRGFVYLKSGAVEAAIGDYDAALATNPDNPYARYGRGVAKLRRGDASGNDDIAVAKAARADIADEFARYGLK